MGRYIRKAKTTGEVAVMEVSQSSFGVRTRAKTLALQRLQKSQALASSPSPASSGSYLQLRSRRLEKRPNLITAHDTKRQRHGPKDSTLRNPKSILNTRTSSRLRLSSSSLVSESNSSVSLGGVGTKVVGQKAEEVVKMVEKVKQLQETHEDVDTCYAAASLGESFLDSEGRVSRGTRESTPCSLIRNPDTVKTPGSTTRPTWSIEATRRTENVTRRHIPTAHEMDEFFAGAEEAQQRQFIKKYNFDPVNEKPLPGHYEWEKLEPWS